MKLVFRSYLLIIILNILLVSVITLFSWNFALYLLLFLLLFYAVLFIYIDHIILRLMGIHIKQHKNLSRYTDKLRKLFNVRNIGIYTYRSDEFNAFSLGSGRYVYIVLSDTLLERLTDAELESILFREILKVKNFHTRLLELLTVCIIKTTALIRIFNGRNGVDTSLIGAVLLGIFTPLIRICTMLIAPDRLIFEEDTALKEFGLAKSFANVLKNIANTATSLNKTLRPEFTYLSIYTPLIDSSTGSLFSSYPSLKDRIVLLLS